MDILAIIRIAMRALARNKMRSSLTMLGIIIGVGAVIAMVSVGQGAQKQAQRPDRSHGIEHVVRAVGHGEPRRYAHGLGSNQDPGL